MTLNQVISNLDNLKPNAYDVGDKTRWLSQIESRIAVISKQNFSSLDYHKDLNRSLLLPEAYSELYIYYLMSMIDFYNQEYSLFNANSTMVNTFLDEYKQFIKGNFGKRTKLTNYF